MKVTAQDIKHALSKRHKEDFFLTEVKDGRTQTGLAIIDAMAVKKSWTKPCISGYEIKVDRQDFLNDEKWPVYKSLCHRFSFVCPKGLIQPHELPEDVGLIYYTPETGNLYTRRKGLFRDIEMSSDMLYYIIMNRLTNVEHPFYSSRREYLESYVADSANTRILGNMVGSKMAKEISELHRKVDSLERQLRSAERDQGKMDAMRPVLRRNGISLFRDDEKLAEDLDKALSKGLPPKLNSRIKDINDAVQYLMAHIEEDNNDNE